MTPRADLLPCPFCGGTPILSGCEDQGYAITCENAACYAFNKAWPATAEHAIQEWNRREAAEAVAVMWRAPIAGGLKWMYFDYEPKHLARYEPLYLHPPTNTDALLALADELDKQACIARDDANYGRAGGLEDAAEAIRALATNS